MAGAFSGLLLLPAFAPANMFLAAWLALVPLLLALRDSSLSRALLAATGFSVTFHGGTLYWVGVVARDYGSLGWVGAGLTLAALVVYLSLFVIAFALLAASACRRLGPKGLGLTPCFWVALELARNYPFGGFPWCLLGYSQVEALAVLQVASLVGIHGVSFLVVLINAALAYCLLPETKPMAKGIVVGLASLVMAATLAFGSRELLTDPAPSTLVVAAVQPNVDQRRKWRKEEAESIFLTHLRLSEAAAAGGAQLIVWPESATPFVFDSGGELAERLLDFVRRERVFLLFGSDDFETLGDGLVIARNGAKLVSPEGNLLLRYHKMRLVPFGEYVPLPSSFGVRSFADSIGDFRPGTKIRLATMLSRKLGAFICYEAIYPDLVRGFVGQGAELLVNVTNDAWFKKSTAPHQHFAMARVRAVESRRYLIRAANTGISAIVDPFGRVLARSELFEERIVSGEVAFLDEPTFYDRYGDFLAHSAGVVTLLTLAALLPMAWSGGGTSSGAGRGKHRWRS